MNEMDLVISMQLVNGEGEPGQKIVNYINYEKTGELYVCH